MITNMLLVKTMWMFLDYQLVRYYYLKWKNIFQKYATRNFLVEKNSNTFRIKVSYMRYTQIAILRFIFVRCTLFICFTTSINWNGMCWVYNHTTIYMIMTIVFELIAFVQRNVTCVCNRISVGLIWILLSIASLNFFIIALFKENWWTLIFVIINGQQQKNRKTYRYLVDRLMNLQQLPIFDQSNLKFI
jgi:hypothetical protein